MRVADLRNYGFTVEMEEQVKMLTGMGCERFQGFYFAKPMAVEDFEQRYRLDG